MLKTRVACLDAALEQQLAPEARARVEEEAQRLQAERERAAVATGLPARLATAEAFRAAVPSLEASKDFAALAAGVVAHVAHVPAVVAALEAVRGLLTGVGNNDDRPLACLLYTSPSPRDS